MLSEIQPVPDTKRPRRSLRTLAIVLVACGLLLAGGAYALTSRPAKGPMEMGEGGITCWQDPTSTQVALFGTVVRVRGDTPIVIEKVELAGADNLRIQESFIVPIINGKGAIGVWEYPPKGDLPGWERAKEAVGAKVAPGRDATVAVAVERLDPARSGSSDHFRVTYRVGGSSFSVIGGGRTVLGGDCTNPE